MEALCIQDITSLLNTYIHLPLLCICKQRETNSLPKLHYHLPALTFALLLDFLIEYYNWVKLDIRMFCFYMKIFYAYLLLITLLVNCKVYLPA